MLRCACCDKLFCRVDCYQAHLPCRPSQSSTGFGDRVAAEARKAAADAADRAVHRLSAEVASLTARLQRVCSLAAAADTPEVQERLTAVTPALVALLRGEMPSLYETLARNVALHAAVAARPLRPVPFPRTKGKRPLRMA